MIICGIKLTHDAAVAVVEDGRLRFCIEVEKLANNSRYSEMGDLDNVAAILESQSVRVADVDRFVVDGWSGDPLLLVNTSRGNAKLRVAKYNEASPHEDMLARSFFSSALPLRGQACDYASYMHIAGHVIGTYCASPFAKRGEVSYVLVWDGGTWPRLYLVNPDSRTVINKGELFSLRGTAYSIIGCYFGPYKRILAELENDKSHLEDIYGLSGKLMSYIALGEVRKELLAELSRIYERELKLTDDFEDHFVHAVRAYVAGKGYSDADVLRTHHTFLQDMLVNGLKSKLTRESTPAVNLCFTGGSALNIKWNSAIRRSGLFQSVWVPPFPNDSGSAIGAACCEMVTQQARLVLEWNVYSGPLIRNVVTSGEWRRRRCDLEDIAHLLAAQGEPIVFMNGAAELGPRALGNRSILAPATNPEMRHHLNRIKGREDFRPVAPICMREHAPKLFDPGTQDPYMLFDHEVRQEWRDRVPAICHLDGTARLQTVAREDNPLVYGLLEAYFRQTGIPVLANTSANRKGAGFFPDVESALSWGGTRYVYCDGILYEKQEGEAHKYP